MSRTLYPCLWIATLSTMSTLSTMCLCAPSLALAEEATPPAAAEAPAEAKTGETEQARQHFERGVDYYGEGDYRAALIEFQRAYSIQPTYRLLYNLGQVAYELRDYAGAERYFRGYLVEGEDELTPERRAEVKEELERLKSRVASLRLHTNQKGAEIHVDDRLIAQADAGPVRVSAGRRQLTAEKPGYAPVTKNIDILGGEELDIHLNFGPALNQVQRAPVAASQGGGSALPWVTGITSGVLLATGAAFGYWAYTDSAHYTDQLQHYTTQSELDRLSSQARSKALVADVLLGTGLAGAVLTTIILLNEDPSEAPPPTQQAQLKLVPTGIQITY